MSLAHPHHALCNSSTPAVISSIGMAPNPKISTGYSDL